MRHSALTTVAVSFFCLIGVDIAAAAQWPASVVGVWDVFANTSHLTLRIGSQGASGACPKIAGTINNIGGPRDPIQGFYCPNSGRISFLRKDASTNDTFQTWTGNVSFSSAVPVRIGGTFAEYNNVPLLGEYNFQASK